MSDLATKQRFVFNIEGRFLGFELEGHKLKYLNVGLTTESFRIKLPKALRLTVQHSLTPEVPIQVSGTAEFDTYTGDLKLKAQDIKLLAPAEPSSVSGAAEHAEPGRASKKKREKPRMKILLCHKSGCQKRGGRKLGNILEHTLRDRNWQEQVDIQYTGCQKRCSSAPSMMIMPGKHLYRKVEAQDVPNLVAKHLGQGERD